MSIRYIGHRSDMGQSHRKLVVGRGIKLKLQVVRASIYSISRIISKYPYSGQTRASSIYSRFGK